MEAKAITRHIRQSPRKIGVVLDEIRGLKFDEALNYLHFSKAKASAQIEKTLRSAYHNLINKIEEEKIESEELRIKECYANGGSHIKRLRAASMRSISSLNKTTSNLTIIVPDTKN